MNININNSVPVGLGKVDVPEKEIPSLLSIQKDKIETVFALIDSLNAKIRPICCDEEVVEKDSNDCMRKTNMGIFLADCNYTLNRCISSLESMLNRIQL